MGTFTRLRALRQASTRRHAGPGTGSGSGADATKKSHTIRKAWRELRTHRWRMALALAALLASIGLGLLRPWPLKLLVDEVLVGKRTVMALPDDPHDRLLAVVALGVAVAGLASFAGAAHTLLKVGLGARSTFSIRSRLFAHLQRLSLAFHDEERVGDLVHRVSSNSGAPFSLLETAIFTPIQSVLTLGGAIAIMVRLDTTLALISLAVVPLLGLALGAYVRASKALSRALHDREGDVSAHVSQVLSAIRVVRSFVREDYEDERFLVPAGESLKARLKLRRLDQRFHLIVSAILGLALALLLYVGARKVMAGALTVGDLLLFTSYIGMLYGPISSLTYLAGSIQGAAASADRVFEVLDHPREVADDPHAAPLGSGSGSGSGSGAGAGTGPGSGSGGGVRGAVELRGVRFRYPSAAATDEARRPPALEGIDLTVEPGESIAIVGPTGAGKSTLVSLIPRFYDPDEGEVRVDGKDLRHVNLRSLRERVGLVLQDTILFPTTILENIAYGRPGASDAEIDAAARAARVDAFAGRLPEGFGTLVGERGVKLSAGERQRIAIARAFLKDAPILILDEPTSALDVETEAAIVRSLEDLMEGRTTFVITHRLSLARSADRIVFLERGHVVEQGPPEELLARPDGAFARFARAEAASGAGAPA